MKRLHVHISVDDLPRSIDFYTTLFAVEPTVVKPDYAKWSLDDPRVNFAISARGRARGLDHLGIETESRDELSEVYGRLRATKSDVFEEGETTCCYARSEKSWIADPAGVLWEAFHTTGESVTFGENVDAAEIVASKSSCCGPASSKNADAGASPSASAGSPCCSK